MPKRFYTALVVLLFILFLFSYLPIHGEGAIYDTVVRLHVLANSNSQEDQDLKLKVRDEVLSYTSPYLSHVSSRDEAQAILEQRIPQIQAIAQAVVDEHTPQGSTPQVVSVYLDMEDYPTKNYESCAFPAGEYLSLRICIGEAVGENWWCVLFPPLCLSAAAAESSNSAEDAFISVGLSKDQYGIITDTQDTKYKIRFKILEMVEELWPD